jgi:CheY-like chemotaxis protein
MFEPFFTTKPVGQGTGLGLSTVLGIVKAHGGFLQVSTEIGQGSEFKIYLPAIEGSVIENRSTEEIPLGRGELMLIVEDDQVVQQTNQSVLENHHYTTLIANDGIEAIALYAQHRRKIKVVLIDIMMPNMDGIAAIRTLKKMKSNVQIIAVSGLSANREAAIAAGASVFLTKPYTIKELLRSISDLVRN